MKTFLIKTSVTQKIKLMFRQSKNNSFSGKILPCLMFLLLISACKKDPEPPVKSYCELHPDECVDVRDVKNYFYFQVGTWWVYEEENSGKRDSVYVTETFSDTGSVIFSTRLFSEYDGYYYRFWTTGVGSNVENNMTKKSERSTRVLRSKGKPGDYVGEATCFLFYPTAGLWTYTNGGGYIGYGNKLEVEEVFENYLVVDESYQNVVKMSEEYTVVEESQPTIHYYCPNVGLIKKELLDSNQIWNLVDYHIEK